MGIASEQRQSTVRPTSDKGVIRENRVNVGPVCTCLPRMVAWRPPPYCAAAYAALYWSAVEAAPVVSEAQPGVGESPQPSVKSDRGRRSRP